MFEEVALVGVDADDVVRQENSKFQFSVKLLLSREPDRIWREHFVSEYKEVTGKDYNSCVIIGDKLSCGVRIGDNIQEQVNLIKQAIKNTNDATIAHLNRIAAEELKRLRDEQEAEDNLKMVKAQLREVKV